MAPTTRSAPRAGARFGRTSASSSAGRFTRAGTTPARGRRSAPRSTSRMPARLGRGGSTKSKQPGGIGGMLARLAPARAASKATPSSKRGKAGGVAVLTAAAGMAFRNRDKLAGMLQRRRSGAGPQETPPATTPAPMPDRAANTPAA